MKGIAPWLLVLAVALAYPLAVLAQGAPPFPSRDDCVRPATQDGEIEAVFGRFASELEASELQEKALATGFEGTEIERDACGHARLFRPVPTFAVGEEFAEQARAAGFDVTLEQAG
jgi:hypothetical protein